LRQRVLGGGGKEWLRFGAEGIDPIGKIRMDMKKALSRLFRLNIAKKLLLGYLSFGVLSILIAFFALSGLVRLNAINQTIIERDAPLVDLIDRAIDTLLAQELYGRRSLILKSEDTAAIFWKRSEAFQQLVQQMEALPDTEGLPLPQLVAFHDKYNDLFRKELQKISRGIKTTSPDPQIKDQQEEIIQLLKSIAAKAHKDQRQRRLETLKIGRNTLWITAGLGISSLLLGFVIAGLVTRKISGSIRQLKKSTQEIAEGKFDRTPRVQSRDELGDLFIAFGEMAKRLKRLEAMNLDANPLTHLPGSAAIEKLLQEKLDGKRPLAFCLLDLSHFKSFNDRYGYVRGNEVIQATAGIIKEAVKDYGPGDFIGHIGGDDFAIITEPGRYNYICRAIIESFDQKIGDFYDAEDRKQGYILGRTRQGQEISMPIMTVAIAVVSNESRILENHIQVGEIAAELKNYAKSFSKSTCIVDKRGKKLPPPSG
jgi:GGDEF domain-containing protein/CHASE3 domain sensor protein